MKRYLIAAALAAALLAPSLLAPTTADASVYVDDYTRRDGTYVPGHHRSSPDSSTSNNWSSSGNTNPYTGERGYRNPYPSWSSPSRSYWP